MTEFETRLRRLKLQHRGQLLLFREPGGVIAAYGEDAGALAAHLGLLTYAALFSKKTRCCTFPACMLAQHRETLAAAGLATAVCERPVWSGGQADWAGAEQPRYTPSLEQIAAATQSLQAAWSERERCRRAGLERPQAGLAPLRLVRRGRR